MHEERDTLWHFVMSIVKYRESHYVRVLYMYDDLALNNTQGSLVSYLQPIKSNLENRTCWGSNEISEGSNYWVHEEARELNGLINIWMKM